MEGGKKLTAKKQHEEKLSADRAFKERKQKFKENDLPWQKKETQEAFNEMIRWLDVEFGCISCDKGPDWQGQWHASHLLTVAAHGHMRYDARNCHKSCSRCNKHLSGNLPAYRINIVVRHGPGILAFVDGPHPSRKWTCEELIAMRVVFRSETRRLIKGLGPSRDWRYVDPAEMNWQAEVAIGKG